MSTKKRSRTDAAPLAPPTLPPVLLPGDPAPLPPPPSADPASTPVIHAGYGLVAGGEGLLATLSGSLAVQPGTSRFALLPATARYRPAKGDVVVGVIVSRGPESYAVDLGGGRRASLPLLAFPGATRKNKPELVPGDTVYAVVDKLARHCDPVLTCVCGTGGGWMTSTAVYGQLAGGALTPVSASYSRRLLDRHCTLPASLGAVVPYEMAVGVNRRVWVKAATPTRTASVVQALTACDGVPPNEVGSVVAQWAAALGV